MATVEAMVVVVTRAVEGTDSEVVERLAAKEVVRATGALVAVEMVAVVSAPAEIPNKRVLPELSKRWGSSSEHPGTRHASA